MGQTKSSCKKAIWIQLIKATYILNCSSICKILLNDRNCLCA